MEEPQEQTALTRAPAGVTMRQLWLEDGVTVGTSVHLSPDLMRRAILRRGLDVPAFAAKADVCAATIYRVLAGDPIRMSTVLKISRSLSRLPVVPDVDELLGEPPVSPFLIRASDQKRLA
jgi:hypothetical protein